MLSQLSERIVGIVIFVWFIVFATFIVYLSIEAGFTFYKDRQERESRIESLELEIEKYRYLLDKYTEDEQVVLDAEGFVEWKTKFDSLDKGEG